MKLIRFELPASELPKSRSETRGDPPRGPMAANRNAWARYEPDFANRRITSL